MAAAISVSSYKVTHLVINSKFTDQVIGKNGDPYIFKECRCDMKSKLFSNFPGRLTFKNHRKLISDLGNTQKACEKVVEITIVINFHASYLK